MLCNEIVLADWEKELWFYSLIVASWRFGMYGQDRESNIMRRNDPNCWSRSALLAVSLYVKRNMSQLVNTFPFFKLKSIFSPSFLMFSLWVF